MKVVWFSETSVGPIYLQVHTALQPWRPAPTGFSDLKRKFYVILRASGWSVCTHLSMLFHVWGSPLITSPVHVLQVTVRNYLQPHPIYRCVTTLRCLYLRDSNPVLWERLRSLESHCPERKKTSQYEEDRVTVAQFARRFFQLQDFEEEEILRMCGILQVRSETTGCRKCSLESQIIPTVLRHVCV
jgi:hypothetical protein